MRAYTPSSHIAITFVVCGKMTEMHIIYITVHISLHRLPLAQTQTDRHTRTHSILRTQTPKLRTAVGGKLSVANGLLFVYIAFLFFSFFARFAHIVGDVN